LRNAEQTGATDEGGRVGIKSRQGEQGVQETTEGCVGRKTNAEMSTFDGLVGVRHVDREPFQGDVKSRSGIVHQGLMVKAGADGSACFPVGITRGEYHDRSKQTCDNRS
jgi:hypothetical protein